MSYHDIFPRLPDEARVWIYAADHNLNRSEQQAILAGVHHFLARWQSHGRTIEGAATFVCDRFLMISGVIPTGGTISGCGIDALSHEVRRLLTTDSPLLVFYRSDDDEVYSLPRSAFRKLVAEGAITPNTRVFDLSLTTMADIRKGAFEKPFHASWHAQIFRLPTTA